MNTVEPTPPRTSRAFAFASGGIALAAAALLAVGLLGSGGQSASAQTGSPTVEETGTASPEATASPTEATPSPTEDASPSPTEDASPSPTEDASPSPSATASPSASPTASPSPAATKSYTLEFRWSLLGWLGVNNTLVVDALTNNLSDDGDLSDNVTALYSWDSANQKWLGYFPGADDIPGANDFTAFTTGQAFWIAISQDQDLTWTIPLP